MPRYIWDGDYEMFVEASRYHAAKANMSKRGDHPAPSVIRDTMDPVQSMLDGQMYDSKRNLRRTYKEAGVVEVGDQVPTTPKEPTRPSRDAVRDSVEKGFAQAGLSPY